jgi:hypothetical protein
VITLLTQNKPNLMSILSAFVDYTFHITDSFWLGQPILSDTSIHDIVAQSKIISTDLLAQVMLIMPAGMVLHFNVICPYGESAVEHVSHITSHLQNPGRLLVGKCTGRTKSDIYEQPEIICVYSGVPEELKYCNCGSDPIALRTGSVIFSLSPVHKVYAAQRQDTHSNIDVETNPMEEASQDTQLGILEIKSGMNLLDVKIGSSTLGRMIGAFEIWEMQDMEESDSEGEWARL